MFKRLMNSVAVLALGLTVGGTAQAQNESTSTAEMPNSINAAVRIAPVAGASSFSTNRTVQTDRFDDGFSAGILADFGKTDWAFETGAIALQASGDANGGTAVGNVSTWGIPLLAKYNFTGKPHETFFLKGGVMPFTVTGDGSNNFDAMGVAGLGGAIPLGRSSALILDATYNRLFTDSGALTDYQGIALLGGLSFNL